jgi:hypothetical protein
MQVNNHLSSIMKVFAQNKQCIYFITSSENYVISTTLICILFGDVMTFDNCIQSWYW